MQGQNSNSTLELVVNEQQLHNMSQIDLSRPTEINDNPNGSSRIAGGEPTGFSLAQLKKWPKRFRENFNAKLNEAKSKSETKTEFIFEVINAFSSIIIWIVCFVCTITLPVILFFIGLINLDDCPDRPSLPYLIFATGFFMTASNLFNLALALDLPVLTNHQILTSDIKNIIASIINMIFNCVVTFLYILSAYMVYTVGNNNRSQVINTGAGVAAVATTETNEDGSQIVACNWLLYHFSFWFVTISLSIVVILCLVGTVLYAYNRYRLAIIRGSTPRSQPNPQTNPLDTYAN